MMNNYSSQIIRAVRKYYQLKQVEFAPILSTTQSALSKIEAGHLELSASQWLAVCDQYTLDPRSLFTGKIENLGERKFGLQDASKVGGFEIPTEYSFLMGSSVRTAYPILKFMKLKLGEKKLNSFLEASGFDVDYFVIMNNPLNIKFIEHCVSYLISEGILTQSNIHTILESSQFKDVHSSIFSDLWISRDLDTGTKRLLSKIKHSYEQNTSYEFLGGKDYVEATDQDFIKEMKLSSEFNHFRQKYNLSHFSELDHLLNGRKNLFNSKETKNGWIISKVS
jgi:hypothetical protein